jgi:hypothetical protein
MSLSPSLVSLNTRTRASFGSASIRPAHRLFRDPGALRSFGHGASGKIDVGEERRMCRTQAGIAARLQSFHDMPVHDARSAKKELPHVAASLLFDLFQSRPLFRTIRLLPHMKTLSYHLGNARLPTGGRGLQ